MAKLFASEMAEKVCSAAIQTLGRYGDVSDSPVERIYRDVRVCQIYEGTSDVQKNIIQSQSKKVSNRADVCGRNLAVCVALDDDDPDLIVITVFVIKNKGK